MSKTLLMGLLVLIVFGAVASLSAQGTQSVQTTPLQGNQQQPAKKKRLLFIGESKGYEHDAVSYAAGTLWKLGHDSGLWDTYIYTDSSPITRKPLPGNHKNLDYFDAVVFYTCGELDWDDSQKADLLAYIKDGHGFMGLHSATDTFRKWPAYGEMIGGVFDGHPWFTFDAPLVVEDAQFPGMQYVPKEFVLRDEIYQVKDFSREKVRVLMRLDESKVNLKRWWVHRTDGDFAVIWAREYGKGRVLYNGLGHVEAVFDRPDIQKMMVEQVKWVLGMVPGDATPRARDAK